MIFPYSILIFNSTYVFFEVYIINKIDTLSIDSNIWYGIIDNKDFDIDKHFMLIKSSKEEMEFSTPFAIVDLDYDSADIVDRLKELTVADYSETLFDKDDDNPPLLFVFGKYINNKEVYIKLKIKGEETKRILCVSFHYAKHKMDYPYA